MDSILILRLSLLGTSVFLGLLLALALFFLRKGNRKANLILVLIVLIYTGSSINTFMMFSGLYKTYPHCVLLGYPFTFLLGFLFYLYIQFLIKPNYQLRWQHAFHLIPFFYVCRNMTQWFYLMATEQKIKTLTYMWFLDEEFTLIELFFNIQASILTLLYLLYSIYILKKHIQKAKNQSSNTQIEFLNWLQYFSYVYLILMIAELTRLGLTYYFKWNPAENEIITNLLATLLIQYIIYQSIVQPEKLFFKGIIPTPSTEKMTTSLVEEIEQSNTDHQAFINKLEKYMDTQKPYLQPNLKIHELANQLQVPPHFLSKIINQQLGINFYTFINNYRIEAFKKQVTNPKNQHLTLTGIALNVGFNSKASFNRIFKKHTNQTPTAYIQQKTVSTSKNKPS